MSQSGFLAYFMEAVFMLPVTLLFIYLVLQRRGWDATCCHCAPQCYLGFVVNVKLNDFVLLFVLISAAQSNPAVLPSLHIGPN